MGGQERIQIHNNNRKRPKKLLTQDIIKRAKTIHGNKYDYSFVEYKNSLTKIKIICPIHGIFEQYPLDHTKGFGCKACSNDKKAKKYRKSNDFFINKAKKIHGNKYDYSLVEYKNYNTKISIICPIHGKFYQTPSNHFKGSGCPTCGGLKNKRKLSLNTFINKSNIIHNYKYDYSNVNYQGSQDCVDIICLIHGVFKQKPNSHLSGSGCPECGKTKCHKNKINNHKKIFLKKLKDKFKNKYDYSLVNYQGMHSQITLICNKHGKFMKTAWELLQSGGCPHCNISYLENEMKQYLNNLNVKSKKIKITGKDIKREIDFFIPEKSIGIEMNGIKWHSENFGNKDRNYHLNKTKLCNKNNIHLIHIFENEWINKQQIIKGRLKSILGKTKYKIYARKCNVKEIDTKLKNKFLNKYHIQGEDKSKIKLGCFYKNRLIAVMTFGKRKITGAKELNWELIRYCTVANFNCIGAAGKLLKYFERNYNPKKIITYADKRWSHGNMYHKLGFKLDHESKPNYWYFDKQNNIYHRASFMKHKLKDKLEKFNIELSEWENMKLNGYDRIWDCGNMVFIKKS